MAQEIDYKLVDLKSAELREKLLDIDYLKKFVKPISHNGIVCEITNDPFYLEQYYKLREESYKEGFGLKNFDGSEDHFDKEGIIAISRLGTKVIGGGRANFVFAGEDIFLPMEEEGFRLRNIFPNLDLLNKNYFEVSRFALTSKKDELHMQTGPSSIMVSSQIGCVAYLLKASYQFNVSPGLTSRTLRRVCTALKLDHKIMSNVKVPHKPLYEQLNGNMLISITNLDKMPIFLG